MKSEIYMVREGKTLVPVDPNGMEILMSLPAGQTIKMEIERSPRNAKHLRKFWAMVGMILPQQTTYTTKEALADALKIGAGHFRTIQCFDGTVKIATLSISIPSMTQAAFNEFYDRVVEVVLKEIIPGVGKEDFENQFYHFLNERGPNDF